MTSCNTDSRVFEKAFPFHITCDKACSVLSLGKGIDHVLPVEITGRKFFDLFTVERPGCHSRSAEGLAELEDRVCWLRIEGLPGFPTLRGQWLAGQDGNRTFLGWPSITSLEELTPFGLDSSFFPPHHPLGDMLSMLETARISTREAEDYARELRAQKSTLEQLNQQLRLRYEEQTRIAESLERSNFLLNLRYELAHVLTPDTIDPGSTLLTLLCSRLHLGAAALYLKQDLGLDGPLLKSVVHPCCQNDLKDSELASFIRAFLAAPALRDHQPACDLFVDVLPTNVFPAFDRDEHDTGETYIISVPVTEGREGHRGWLLLIGEDPRCLEPPTLDFLRGEGTSLAKFLSRSQAIRSASLQQMRMDAILESSLDAIVTATLDGNVVGWNGSAERIFGYSAENAIGRTVSELLVPPELRDAHGRGMARYASTGQGPMLGALVEVPALCEDGHRIPVEMAISPFHLGDEEYVTATMRNITDRKLAQERIEVLARFPEDNPSPVLRIGRDGCLLYANPASRVWRDILPIGEGLPVVPEWVRLIQRTLQYGEPVSEEWHIAGSYYLVRIVPVGETYVNVYATCIDELKQREQQNNALNAELEERVEERTSALRATIRELESFTYSVSHDLRAPLRAIHGFSQFLVEDYGKHLPEGGLDLLADIRANATRMGGLIDDLLELSRLGQTALQQVTVSPRQIAEQVVASHLRRIEESGAQVRVTDMPELVADPRLLSQLYENLIGNALKYGRPGSPPRIDVGAMEIEGCPAYYVRDDGIGFDMRYHDRLFDVFQRLHTDDTIEGNGVGLAIVRRIVEKHRGAVWAESAPNRGSTFYFRLGLSNDEPSGDIR